MLNQNEKNQFLQLVEKYVSGDATEQEKAFLEAYYQHHENKPDWLNELTEAEKDALDASLREATSSPPKWVELIIVQIR